MDAAALRDLQAPLKERYRNAPETAVVTLRASGRIDQDNLTCRITTRGATADAGLHPATGGTGEHLCSGDMLLESLAACAGVTLAAVATAFGMALREGSVDVEGDLDFRGTLGVAKDAPVGFRAIRMRFDLETDEEPDRVAKLIELTERYCVVYQTLAHGIAADLSYAHRPHR